MKAADRAPPGFAAYYAAVFEDVDASRPNDPDGNADSRQRGDG